MVIAGSSSTSWRSTLRTSEHRYGTAHLESRALPGTRTASLQYRAPQRPALGFRPESYWNPRPPRVQTVDGADEVGGVVEGARAAGFDAGLEDDGRRGEDRSRLRTAHAASGPDMP
eukprot:2707331-Rhodomonas_salina.1